MDKHAVITRETIPLKLAREFYDSLQGVKARELAVAIDWVEDEKETITLALADCAKALEKFAAHQGVTVSDPISILQALFSLEGLRAGLGWDSEALVSFLSEDAEEGKRIKSKERHEELKNLLGKFFGKSPKLARTLKAQKVYDGLIPNFESCWSLAEFRPIYDDARSKILNGIIAASFTFQVRPIGAEEAPETISFQLDVADIEQVIGELKKLNSKISALKQMVEKDDFKLLNPSKSLKEANEL
jgi:hypothetical protein